VNIKDIFDKGENGTLTYAQFEAFAKADGAKFTDLSEGKYVSKDKYDDGLGAKDKSIEQLNSTIAQRDTDLENLKKQLASAGTDAEKLSKLQSDFDALQGRYTTDMEAYQKQIASQQYEFACREFANGKKFSSNAARRDFTTAMIGANLKFDNGKIMGAEDFVESYSKDNADAFVKEDEGGNTPPPPANNPAQPKPHFAGPTGGTNSGSESKNIFGFNFTPIRPMDKKE
jgi:hypothetical protein